jgi:hypothetical protein
MKIQTHGGFDIFINGGHALRAFERYGSRCYQQILILDRMTLQF